MTIFVMFVYNKAIGISVIFQLLLGGMVGAIVYLVSIYILKLDEVMDIMNMIRKKINV